MSLSQPRLPRPKRADVPPGKVLCEYCSAKCCRYFALPIDTPTERKDYDTIRWFLLHERASVFKEDGDWYILVHTVCKHLQADNRCGIYERRPRICRGYSTDNCDYHGGDYNYTELFTSADQLRVYAEKQLGRSLPLKVRTRPSKAKRGVTGKMTLQLPVV